MQPIIQHLFQASRLEDVSLQRLESFVEEYPSFGIGHYLLSRKLRAEGAGNYIEETQKTNLYFTNPFWLQWMLENADPLETVATTIAPSLAELPSPAIEEATPEEEAPVSIAEPADPIVKDTMETVVEEALFTGHTSEPLIAEPSTELPATEPYLAEAPLREEPAHTEPTEEVPAGITAFAMQEQETTDEESMPQPGSMVALAEKVAAAEEEEPTAAELLLQSIQEAKGLRDSLQKMNEDFNTGKVIAPEIVPIEVPASIEVPTPIEASAPAEVPIKDEEPPFVLEEQESAPVEQISLPTPVETADAPTAPAEESQSPARTEQPQPAAATEPLLFEPYHTIDYFASQGIKLTLEENPSDQLGKQLKSFTDWLKVMRRLPQKEREIIPDRAIEQSIQNFAAHSVVGREILTETMAEVLAKQGMPERARTVYEKLSLLNPDKRAYFATKIEQLNNR